MPELPEVEIMARNLHQWLVGSVIQRVDVLDAKFDAEALSSIEGSTVVRAWRRAKYAVVDLDSDHHLVFHYRMTGKTVLDPTGRRKARLRLVPEQGCPVAFEDTRRFGEVWVLPSDQMEAFFEQRKLGPEPWPVVRDGSWWSERLSGLKGEIKPALMKQDRVAGLGNIIASEVCYRACVDPRKPVAHLQAEDWQEIAQAVRLVIDRTLVSDGGDEIMYVNMGGENFFAVYGREGSACQLCDTPIERITQSGRSSFFCPNCQSR
ncbi:MAG: Fpg/Nei family DNA glycosylase [Myxococcota bacterium]